VEFHPAWHNLMRLAVGEGIHNLPWASLRPGTDVVRAAMAVLASQDEAAHMCPISMTYSAGPVHNREERSCSQWLPRICSPVRSFVLPWIAENRRPDGNGYDREAGWFRRALIGRRSEYA
jgi:putative acyl-CoA dehydrogenase